MPTAKSKKVKKPAASVKAKATAAQVQTVKVTIHNGKETRKKKARRAQPMKQAQAPVQPPPRSQFLPFGFGGGGSGPFSVVNNLPVPNYMGYNPFNQPQPFGQAQAAAVGVPGPAGPRGVAGPRGSRGMRGATGPAGVDGSDGLEGMPGEQGLTGPTGLTGLTGERGLFGLTGEQGPMGYPGERGEQGERGLFGLTGEQGPMGYPGERGEQGEQGRMGLRGPKGPIGLGLRGPTGGPGGRGIKGERGDRGLRGERGEKGEKGEQGPPGADGMGYAGPEGPVGQSGQDANPFDVSNLQRQINDRVTMEDVQRHVDYTNSQFQRYDQELQRQAQVQAQQFNQGSAQNVFMGPQEAAVPPPFELPDISSGESMAGSNDEVDSIHGQHYSRRASPAGSESGMSAASSVHNEPRHHHQQQQQAPPPPQPEPEPARYQHRDPQRPQPAETDQTDPEVRERARARTEFNQAPKYSRIWYDSDSDQKVPVPKQVQRNPDLLANMSKNLVVRLIRNSKTKENKKATFNAIGRFLSDQVDENGNLVHKYGGKVFEDVDTDKLNFDQIRKYFTPGDNSETPPFGPVVKFRLKKYKKSDERFNDPDNMEEIDEADDEAEGAGPSVPTRSRSRSPREN